MAHSVQVGNFLKLMEVAHSVKGSSAYAGASRVWEDWYWIQVHFDTNQYILMVKSFVSLLEHWVQFRVHWRKEYWKYKNIAYYEKPENVVVPLPFGWKLDRISDEDFKITPCDDFLELAEEAEISGKRYVEVGDKYEVQYEFNKSSSEKSFVSAVDKYIAELSIPDSYSVESVSSYKSVIPVIFQVSNEKESRGSLELEKRKVPVETNKREVNLDREPEKSVHVSITSSHK